MDSPHGLKADLEGLEIWASPDGKGFLVLSNQGADNYAVYRREAPHAFVGKFHVVANEKLGIDGASETDGLDVVSAPLGPDYPAGLLVVQDGRNLMPPIIAAVRDECTVGEISDVFRDVFGVYRDPAWI